VAELVICAILWWFPARPLPPRAAGEGVWQQEGEEPQALRGAREKVRRLAFNLLHLPHKAAGVAEKMKQTLEELLTRPLHDFPCHSRVQRRGEPCAAARGDRGDGDEGGPPGRGDLHRRRQPRRILETDSGPRPAVRQRARHPLPPQL